MEFSLSLEPARTRGVFISTYGCQMNVNDTERMYALLEMVDYVPVATPEQAELILINSCSVREKPVHKVHSEVGRYRELKALNPLLRIGVGGCVAQQEKRKLLATSPLIDFVFGTDAIDELPDIVTRISADRSEKVVSARFESDQPYQIQTLIRRPGVAAFVNITKGCDNFCTFCVVPFTRGREKSRPLRDLLTDVRSLVDRGVKEVTLLGQNVNSYGSDCGVGFPGLLEALAEGTGIERIRYTTSHPKDFDQDLVDVSRRHRGKIMDYIHLPAQSGNTDVLSRMNRGYSREQYLDKLAMIRAGLPGVALSTDLIVGFPGETDAQFDDTMTLLEAGLFENVYAFKYSPRPFTKAARFADQVPDVISSARLDRLLRRQRVIAAELAAPYAGRVLDVLVEGVGSDDGLLRGRSTQNKLSHVPIPTGSVAGDWIGRTVAVQVSRAHASYLAGTIRSGVAV